MSFAGTGTVKESWQQAHNLITQQTQIIITELVESERKRAVAERGRQDAERALESFKANPDAYSEGWYVKQLGIERERRQVVESNLRRQTEFGKLKDRAKIKVEMTRDRALRENARLKEELEKVRVSAQKIEALTTANEQQAIAWKEAVIKRRDTETENARLKLQIQRLEDVLRLGREGLRREQW